MPARARRAWSWRPSHWALAWPRPKKVAARGGARWAGGGVAGRRRRPSPQASAVYGRGGDRRGGEAEEAGEGEDLKWWSTGVQGKLQRRRGRKKARCVLQREGRRRRLVGQGRCGAYLSVALWDDGTHLDG